MPRRIRALTAAVISTFLAVVLTGTHAHADPTVAQVEAQLKAAWNQAEPLIEKYNEIHEQYQKNKARQTVLLKQIAPLQAELEVTQARVGEIAAAAYKGGRANAVDALFASLTPRQLVDQLTYVDMLAREQTTKIQATAEAKARYDAQKAPIDKLVMDLAAQDADLAKRRKEIETRLAELQKLRIKVYGTTGGIGRYRPWTCPTTYLNTKGYKAANFACHQTGKAYVWAASGPSTYDCSGLTLRSWSQVGVFLPHNAAQQRRSMPYVSRANIQIGDLIFYYAPIHHVGIYVGNGKMVNAPNAGDVVRMVDMDTYPINSIGRPG